MSRRLPTLLVFALALLACSPTPPERAPLPEVGEVLDPPAQCSFLVGEPEGVLVQEVIADSAAEGVLLAGDVIVAFDDAPTPDSEALLSALSGRSAGEMVDIDYLRDDVSSSSSITLGANPDDSSQPRIGVMIRTQYQIVEATEVDTEVDSGPLTRPISIGASIYLLDPDVVQWEQTPIEVTDELNWVSTSNGIYSISGAVLTDLSTGGEIPHDGFEGWEPIRLIGSVGADLLLVVTQAVPEDPSQVAVGVSRFDPVERTTTWATPVVDGFGIPITALGSPGGESMVVVGVSEGGADITGVDLWTGDGEAMERTGMTELGTPVGWMDEATILFRSALETVSLYSVADGATATLELEAALGGLPLFPVGDGSRVLAVDDTALLLEDLTVPSDLRVLAENCGITRVGEPGWSP